MKRGVWGTAQGFGVLSERIRALSTDGVRHELVVRDADALCVMDELRWCASNLTSNSKVSVRTTAASGTFVRNVLISNIMRQSLSDRGCASALQLMDLSEADAAKMAEREGLMLVRAPTTTGFWMVKEEHREGRSPRPFLVETVLAKVYHDAPSRSFRTAAACALAIARVIGPEQSMVFALNFPEDTQKNVLLSLRSPCMLRRRKRSNMTGCTRCAQPLDCKSSWCKRCNSERHSVYAATWRGQAAMHLAHSKEHTLQRNGQKRGRNGRTRLTSRGHEAPEWKHIDHFRRWLADALERQAFSCEYSRRPLAPLTFSLERLDETRGYDASNCVLVDRHFQGTFRQWSRAKFLAVPSLRVAPSHSYTDMQLKTFMRRKYYRCSNSTDARNNKGRAHTIDLTVDGLMRLWRAQEGRCAYLGVPLTLEGEWQASVERLDDAHGYTLDNVVLIALEVQLPIKWSRSLADALWPRAQLHSRPLTA